MIGLNPDEFGSALEHIISKQKKKEVHHRIRIEVKGVVCLPKYTFLQSHRVQEFGSTLDHDGVSHFITSQSMHPVELNMSITT